MRQRAWKSGASRQWALGAPVIAFAESPTDRVIAVAIADGTLRLHSLDANAELGRVRSHTGAVMGLVHHAPTGDFLTAGDDGRVCRVDSGGASAEVARLGWRWVEHLIADPVSGWVAASIGHEIHAITPDLGLTVPMGTVPSAPGGFSLDSARGRLAVAHYGGVSLRSLDGKDAVWSRLEFKGSHLAVAASPNGKWVVSATQESTLHVWPLDGGGDCGMRGYPAKPTSLSWSADSRLLMTSGLDSLIAWRFDGAGPKNRDPIVLGVSAGGLGTRVAAHPKVAVGAVGFDNGAVLFADLDERRAMMLKEPDGSEVTAITWSADGAALLVGQDNGVMTIFELAI